MGTWLQGVGERLFQPGVGVTLLGAVLVFTSGPVARRWKGRMKKEYLDMIMKAVGCVLMAVGAIMIFTR